MIKFFKNDYILIPIACNIMFNSFSTNTRNCKFSINFFLKEIDINVLINYININVSETKYIGLDLEYVTNSESRVFKRFQSLNNIERIVFLNIDENSIIYQKLMTDLQELNPIYYNRNVTFGNTINSNISYADNFKFAYNERIESIITSFSSKEVGFLNSSSVWSNYYVDFKKLFLYTEETKIILFRMATIVNETFSDFDAIISASKTGSVLANMLGYILDRKVIHFISIGPMFAITEKDILEKIKSHKKYLYIGDFICLGTEIKILNAIISNVNSELIGGVVISSYLNFRLNEFSDSILGKMQCIRKINDCGIDYKIVGDKKYLENINEHNS